MTGLGSKARCTDVHPATGIKPQAGLTPHCLWIGDCSERGCFWARFHQVTPQMKPRPQPPGQAELLE